MKELEYIAALHQTCMPLLRENGTVSSVDICRFLKSRTGLNVPHEHGIRIVRGLGGGVVGDDVIQKILDEIKEPEKVLEQNERKRLWKKIHLAKTLDVLAKRERSEKEEDVEQIVHEQDFWTFESPQEQEEKKEETLVVDDEAAVDADLENANDGIIGDAQDEEYLDLVQLMAILFMPTLARAGKEWHDVCIPEVYLEEVVPNYQGFRGWCRKMDDKLKAMVKERDDALYESLRPKPETILQDVLGSMLKCVDMESGDKYPVMNAQLVRNLLRAQGEYERAADSVLVDKMVEAASSTTGLFDEEAFVTALTCDLSEWKVGSEDNQTTTFLDVWGFGTNDEKATVEAENRNHIQDRENDSTSNEGKNLSEDAVEAESRDEEKNLCEDAVEAERKGHIKDGEKNSTTGNEEKNLCEDAVEAERKGHIKDGEKNSTTGNEEKNLSEDAVEAESKGHIKDGEKNSTTGNEENNLSEDAVEAESKDHIKDGEKNSTTGNEEKHPGEDTGEAESKDLDGEKNSTTGNEEKNQGEDVRKYDADGGTSRIEDSDNNLNEDVGKGHLVEEPNGVNDGAKNADDGKDDYEIDRRQSWIDIDFSIDTHSSLVLTVAIFFFFISTSLVYVSLFEQIPALQPQCGDDFGCLLATKIVTWMILAVFLALSGCFVIIPLSIRNNPAERSPLRNLFSLIWSLIINWMPFAAIEAYKEGTEPPYDGPRSTVEEDDYSGAQWVTRVIGLIVSLFILIQFVLAVIGSRRIRASNLMRYLFDTSNDRRSARVKKAATRKINTVLQNAHNLRPMITSAHNGPALQRNYAEFRPTRRKT